MSNISHNENKMIHDSKRLLESGTVDDPVEILRLMCLSRGFSGFLGFGRCFREMDHNGEKILNLEQFTKAMNDTGLEVPVEQVEEIFNRFDMDGSGGINIANLMASIRVRTRSSIIYFDIYRTKISSFQPEMSNSRRAIVNTAFNKVDKLEAGTVSMDALKWVAHLFFNF